MYIFATFWPCIFVGRVNTTMVVGSMRWGGLGVDRKRLHEIIFNMIIIFTAAAVFAVVQHEVGSYLPTNPRQHTGLRDMYSHYSRWAWNKISSSFCSWPDNSCAYDLNDADNSTRIQLWDGFRIPGTHTLLESELRRHIGATGKDSLCERNINSIF